MFVEAVRVLLEAVRVIIEAVRKIIETVRLFVEAVRVLREQSRPQQQTWNSKLFVIFRAETTAAHSPHFQHLYVD